MGDIPFHYGRWVYDPFDGWLWVPGYVWSPAWVVWRSGGGNIGWFPMPPDDEFLYGGNPYVNRWDNWGRGFGYADWYGPSFGLNTLLSFWIFVEERRFADRDYIRYIAPRNNYTVIVNNTTNITNYVTVNNYIVNRSVDVGRVERAAGRPIRRVEAREVLRRNATITRIDQGSRVQENERRQHGGNRNASARERIVALPEARARAIGPPLDSRPDRERLERVIPPQGNGKAGPSIERNERVQRERPGQGNGPDGPRERAIDRGNPNPAPDVARQRAIERRAGPNETIARQQPQVQQPQIPQNEPPRGHVRQRQGGQTETPQADADNGRIDRRQQPDNGQKAAGRERGAGRRE